MYPRGRPPVNGGFGFGGPELYDERGWEDGYDPRYEQFFNPTFNSYASGPGAHLPWIQQPFNRRQRDLNIPYTLFVTNFNASTQEDGLRNVFSMYGTPLKVERKRDRYNDPIAFVDYATQREADAAIAGLNLKPPLGWCVTYARDRTSDDGLVEELFEFLDSRIGLHSGYGPSHQMRPATVAGNQHANDYYEHASTSNMDYPPCVICGLKARYTCPNCPIRYCGKQCQHQDWPGHKLQCQPPPPLKVVEPAETGHSRPISGHTGAIPRDRVIELPARAPRNPPSSSAARPYSEVQQLQSAQVKFDLRGSVQTSGATPFHNANQYSAESTVSPVLRGRAVLTDAAAATLAPTGIKPLDDYVLKQSKQQSPQESLRSASRINDKNLSTLVRAQSREPTGASEGRPISQQSNRMPNPQANTSVKSPQVLSPVQATAQLPATPKPALKKFAKMFAAGADKQNLGSKTALVVLCFAKSPDEFYVQLKSSHTALSRTMDKIQEQFGECSPLLQPRENQPCLAIFEDLWYRAIVLKVLGSDVGVRYVDYGNTARIANAIENVRMMPEELSVQPFCAIRAKLAGVAPIRSDEWDNETRAKFKAWAEYQDFNMQIESNDRVLTVTLKKAEGGQDVGEYLIANNLAKSLSKMPVPANIPSPSKKAQPFSDAPVRQPAPSNSLPMRLQPAVSASSAGQRNVQNPANISTVPVSRTPDVPSIFDSLKVGQVVDYFVVVPLDPNHLISVGSILKDEEAIQRVLNFNKFAEEAFQRNPAATLKSPMPGSLVAAYSPSLKEWYRAYVMSSKSDQSSHAVFYVDFGNKEEVEKINVLPPGFDEPYLAVKLELIGEIDSKILENATEFLVAEKVNRLVINNCNSNGTLIATLTDIHTDRKICEVSIDTWKSLVEAQPTVTRKNSVPSASAASETTRSVPVSVPGLKPIPLPCAQISVPVQTPKQMPTQLPKVPDEIPAQKMVHTPVSASTAAPIREPPQVAVPMREIHPLKWQSDITHSVVVSNATSLDSIWVQPLTEELLKETDEIQFVVNDLSPKASAFQSIPAVGSYVAAIFPDDECFYRAKIRSVSGSSIDVLFIDYGNSAVVTLDKIRPLPDELFTFAACSSRVVLDNVPASGPVPAQLDELIQELNNQQYELQVTSTMPDAVEGVLTKDGTVLNEKINQLFNAQPPTENSIATNEAVASEMPELVEAAPCEAPPVDNTLVTVYYDDGPFLDLPESDTFEALILNCPQPTTIQICSAANEEILNNLEKLKEDMTTYAEGLIVGFSPNVSEISMVRFKRPMDSSPYWYRGACLQVVDEDNSKIYFMLLVDFGDMAIVDCADLRRIPKRFVDFCPFVAQQAILKDVQNLDVSEALAQRVAELLPLYCKVECKVVDRDGVAYVIDIPSVSSVLRSEGLI